MKPRTKLLLGFLIVTALYLSSMRGLLRIEHRLFADDPGPIRLLELGVTLAYLVAVGFTAYIARKPANRQEEANT